MDLDQLMVALTQAKRLYGNVPVKLDIKVEDGFYDSPTRTVRGEITYIATDRQQVVLMSK